MHKYTHAHIQHTHNVSGLITSLCNESKQFFNWYNVQDKVDGRDGGTQCHNQHRSEDLGQQELYKALSRHKEHDTVHHRYQCTVHRHPE